MTGRQPAAAEDVRPLRRDAAENRRRLLVAAKDVFAERGPDACVEEIARAAGVGMGTLYRRFPTKQDLVDELVGALREHLASAATAALDRPDEECLAAMMMSAGEVTFAGRGVSHGLWFSTPNGNEYVEQFRAALREGFRRAQRAGAVRADLTVADIYAALWSVRGVVEQTHLVAPAAWRRHLAILLAGFRPGPGLAEAGLSDADLSRVQADQAARARR
jgi:AcrR family transcriptional regulator